MGLLISMIKKTKNVDENSLLLLEENHILQITRELRTICNSDYSFSWLIYEKEKYIEIAKKIGKYFGYCNINLENRILDRDEIVIWIKSQLDIKIIVKQMDSFYNEFLLSFYKENRGTKIKVIAIPVEE